MKRLGSLSEILRIIFRTGTSQEEVTLEPNSSSSACTFQLPSGSSTHEITANDLAQELTNKTLTSPQVNEAVALTATATELNQLDGVSVGGNTSGDILTTDDIQTISNKSIAANQIDTGTLPNARIQVTGVTQHQASIDHDSLLNTHDLTSDIDHDSITNTHNLTTDINHNTITNGTASSSVHGVTGSVVGTSDTQVLTNKDVDSLTASNTSRVTVGKDTKANLDLLSPKEATVVYATDEGLVYVGNGSSWTPVGGSFPVSKALAASGSTNVFTQAFSGAENLIIKYSLKDTVSSNKRVGQLFITTDGSVAAIADSYTDTAGIDVVFSVQIVGTDLLLDATVGSNAVNMKYKTDSWAD